MKKLSFSERNRKRTVLTCRKRGTFFRPMRSRLVALRCVYTHPISRSNAALRVVLLFQFWHSFLCQVVASHDPKAVQYNIELRLQPPREETILDFKNIMVLQLKYFYEKTKHQPERIVYYRDGVSDGQFQQVCSVNSFSFKTRWFEVFICSILPHSI